MSFLKKQFTTTGSDRRKRYKNVEEMNKTTETEVSQIQNGGADQKNVNNAKTGAKAGPRGEQNGNTTDLNEPCFSCDKITRKNGGSIACSRCEKCFCNSCANLAPSTVRDIAKYRGLLWFCEVCIVQVNLENSMQHSQIAPTTSENTVTQLDTEAGRIATASMPKAGTSHTISEAIPQTEDPTLNKIITTLEILQVKVCGMEDKMSGKKSYAKALTPSNNPSIQATPRGSVQTPNTPVTNLQPVNQQQTQNEQLEITVTDGNMNRPLTENQVRVQQSLQNRETIPRPAIATEVMEAREIERRKNNIVIHNLIECNSTSAEERRDYDEMEVSCMLAGMRLLNTNVEKAIRLGNRSDDKPGPRPLLVTLNAQREEVIKRSRFVRRYKDWARVFIDPDRTQKEQEEHKALRIEFKQRQEAGENIIFRNGKILKKNTPRREVVPDTEQEQTENADNPQNGETITLNPQEEASHSNEGQENFVTASEEPPPTTDVTETSAPAEK